MPLSTPLRVFYARVTVEGEVRGEGKGRSKKEAEAHAAQRALEGYGQN
ncbi:MAG: putative dsRNA-binding protein [Coriobacteriaceae bacterium]|nr:putative dsRNA-binding protein [Coriobacteriaceae bacterium]